MVWTAEGFESLGIVKPTPPLSRLHLRPFVKDFEPSLFVFRDFLTIR